MANYRHPFKIVIFLTLFLSTLSLFGAGEIHDGKVSAYLRGSYLDANSLEAKLKEGGFEVLGKDHVTPDITTILFTCPTLKKIANKPKRGFGAVLRASANQKDNEISITNPLYFEKAYLQKEYDEAAAKKVLGKLNTLFPNLKDSKDSLKNKELAKYHFTFAMPYYEDMITVSKGAHNDLVAKIKSKNPVFILTLDPNRTLVGYKLSDDTAKFIDKIGTKNGIVLPYTILIEGDKAYILAPKYYLALSYPQLKMTQFMTISSTPGKIEKEIKAAFK